MEKQQIRECFLTRCSLAAEPLRQNGFRCLQRGQCWKKNSANKDMTYEVFFQSSHYNTENSIKCMVRLDIYSKKVKAFKASQGNNPYESGSFAPAIVCGEDKELAEWNFANAQGEKAAQEIAGILEQYAIPVFELFEKPEAAVEQLKMNSMICNDRVRFVSPLAFSFMLLYGGKEAAEIYMNRFLSDSPKSFRERVKQWYPALKDAASLDLNYDEFVCASVWKQAYLNGIRLHFDSENM